MLVDWYKSPSRSQRAVLAVIIGLAFGALAWAKLRSAGPYALAYDFTFHWRAGDALRRGYSPYEVINGFSTLYPFTTGYLYWLPTAVMLEPFALLPMQTAMPIFAGLSATVFAYALTTDGYWRLPFIASAPFLFGVLSGQVVPLVVAAMLIPALGFLAPMKYTSGAAGFAYNLSWKYATLAATVVIVSVVAWPWWPRQWLNELHDVVGGPYYSVPLLLPGGFILLASLLKWRRPEARLLAAMACAPQLMLFYDQLPLLVIAKSRQQALAMAVASWFAPALGIALHGASADSAQLFRWNASIILACYYLPGLAIVLMRPNAAQAE